MFAPLGIGSNNIAPTRTLNGVGITSEIVVDPAGDIFFDEADGSWVTEYPAGTNTAPQSYSWSSGAAYAFALDGGQLYVSAGGAVAQSNPPNPGWFTFDLANPNAGPIPFMSNANVTRMMTSY